MDFLLFVFLLGRGRGQRLKICARQYSRSVLLYELYLLGVACKSFQLATRREGGRGGDVSKPELKFHKQSCFTCRYYRTTKEVNFISSNCLLLGRMLSQSEDSWHDRARFCCGWKQRPKTWSYFTGTDSCFWKDVHYTRESLMRVRKRAGIKP